MGVWQRAGEAVFVSSVVAALLVLQAGVKAGLTPASLRAAGVIALGVGLGYLGISSFLARMPTMTERRVRSH